MRAPPPGLTLLACTIVWGSTFVVTKSLLDDAPPLLYLTIRFCSAAALLLPVLLLRGKKTPHLLRDGLVLSVFNALGLLFQVFGQCYTTPAKSAFITSLNTPLTALAGFVLYRQAPTRAQRVAVVLASVGLALLTWPSAGAHFNPGDLLTVGCATFYAIFIVESARRALHHDAITMAIFQVTFAALLFTSCWLLMHAAMAHGYTSAFTALEARPFPRNTRVLVQMVYMSVVCVALIMLAQTWALQRLPATTAAVIYALEPVVATAIAVALDGAAAVPGPHATTGALLVLCAIYVAERRALRRSHKKKSKTSAHSGDVVPLESEQPPLE